MPRLDPDLVAATVAAFAAGTVLLSAWLEPRWPRLRPAFTALLVLAGLLAAWRLDNGERGRHLLHPVHAHEQYHFVLGERYMEELRYDHLYLATLAAGLERGEKLPDFEIRDPDTFVLHRADELRGAAWQARARFSPERWAAFQADVLVLQQELRGKRWGVLSDHGFTASPAWATVARGLVGRLPIRKDTLPLFGAVDLCLLAALLGLAWRHHGARTAAVLAVLVMLPARIWPWLGGSLLRMDWLFALAGSAILVGANKPRGAGLLLGYAISSKAFCAVPALFMALPMLRDAIAARRPQRDDLRLVAWAFAGLLASVVISSLVFGPGLWLDYAERIRATLTEGYYRGQYSFRDVGTQLHFRPDALFDPLPDKVFAARRKWLEHPPPTLPVGRILLGLGLAFAAWRNHRAFAAWVGVLGIFLFLVSNIYYWQLLGLLALGTAVPGAPRRHALLLALGLGFVALGRMPDLYGWGNSLHGYWGSFWLTWVVLLTILLEVGAAAWAWRGQRRDRRAPLPPHP
ncbi:hypothetical protein L6R53_04540 [Myxococcota bacterium]|nr:hypothetical protein [Myxococcota bacterium]